MIRRLAPIALLIAACGSPAAVPSASPTPAVALVSPTAARTSPPTPTPPPNATATPIVLPSFASLSASGSVVWALVAGTRLFRSTDRGDTWTERPLPSPAPANLEISFTSDTQGWLSSAGTAAAQCQTQTVSLSQTSDGGATWLPVAATGIPPAQCKENLSFVELQRGFLSAWDPNSAPVIYHSPDGGRTWSASKPLPDPPGFTTTSAGFALRAGAVRSIGATLFVEAVGQTTSGQRRYAFTSTDGGATWTYRANAPDPDNAIVFVTATRWLQISTPSTSQETTDAGASWHALTTDYQQAAPVAPAIVFGDAQIGYATVRGQIKRTVDGGAHWTALKTPGT